MPNSAMAGKAFFFGCWGRVGHYFFDVYGSTAWNNPSPWDEKIDAKLPPLGDSDKYVPGSQQVEGLAKVHHKNGWTALAFWDRSVDHRSNSNAVFIMEGNYDFDEMVVLAKENFPAVWARFKFPVVEAE